MAKVNRTRGYNLLWGDKQKKVYNIPDYKFDFSGKAPLISLNNGGGKTTLFHMEKQAISPNSDFSGHNFRKKFFSINTAPVVSLKEFVLENDNGYVTVGSFFKYVNATDKQDARLVYFNVIIQSERINRSSPLDIFSDAVVKTENNTIEDWSEMRRKIERFGREDESVHVQIFDNKSEYIKALEAFGIYPDEIDHISKYEDENGLGSFVEKRYNTSVKLIDEWALPAIGTVFPDCNPAYDKKVENVLKFVDEYNSGLVFLSEKPIYEELIKTTKRTISCIDDLQDPISDIIDAKDMLRNRYFDLLGTSEQAENAIQSAEGECAVLIDNERKLRWMDVSRRFHEKNDQILAQQELCDAIETERDNIRSRVEELDLSIITQKYAQLSERRNIAEEERKAMTESLNMSDDAKTQELQVLSSSLRSMCENRLSELQMEIDQITEDVHREETERTELSKTNDSARKKSADLQAEISVKNREIEEHLHFSDDVSKLEQTALPMRDMMNSPYDDVVIEGEISRLLERKQTEQDLLKEIEERRITLQEEYDVTKDESIVTKSQLADCEKKQNVLEAEIEKTTILLDRSAASFEYLHIDTEDDKERSIEHAEAIRSEFILKMKDGDAREAALISEIMALQEGTSFSNDAFARFLDENGWGYETGEQYLRNLGVAERRRMLETIPYFPVAFIVRQDVYERIETMKDALSDQNIGVVPILSYDSMGEPVGDEHIHVFCDPSILDHQKRKEYLRERQLLLEKQKQANDRDRQEFDVVQNHIRQILRYYDTKDKLSAMTIDLEAAEKEVEGLSTRLEKLQRTVEQIGHQIDNATADSEKHRKSVMQYSEALEKVKELSTKEKLYAKTVSVISSLTDEWEQIRRQIVENEGKINSLEQKIRMSSVDLSDRKRDFGEIQNEAEEYTITTEERIEGNLDELRTRYVKIKRSMEDSIRVLQNEIEHRQKIIDGIEKEMADTDFDEVDKENLPPFDSVLLDRLKNDRSLEKEELEEKDDALHEEELRLNTLQSKLEEYVDNNQIEESNVIERDEIDFNRNYVREAEECKDKAGKLTDSIAQYQDLRHETELLCQRIELLLSSSKPLSPFGFEVTPVSADEIDDVADEVDEYVQMIKDGERRRESITNQLNSMHDEEEKRDYKSMQNMNVCECIKRITRSLKSDDDSEVLKIINDVTSWLNDNIDSINKYISVNMKDHEQFTAQFTGFINNFYKGLLQEMDELNVLSSLSNYSVGGTTQKTVRIIPPKSSELHGVLTAEQDEQNMKKLNEYIMSICRSLPEVDRDERYALVKKKLSNRAVLGLFMDYSKWKVKLWKVDETGSYYADPIGDRDSNSGFSGAQHALAAFFLMITEMYYRRKQMNIGVKESFIYLDNPFGPVNYEIGVNAFLDAAKRAGVQVIATTGHKDSTIAEAFDVLIVGQTKPYIKDGVIHNCVEFSYADVSETSDASAM